jgi:capsular exopolysaccharide synthesis family protein
MSKITQALEKAARERLLHRDVRPNAPATAVTMTVLPTPSLGETARMTDVQVDPHIISLADTKSPIAEQYRILKMNLQTQGGQAKTFVVTSALRGEGKSVTSLNLAATLARDERLKVVLVDADLRKSSVNKWLGLAESAEGLSNALQHGGVLNGTLIRLASPALTILPAGPAPDDPASLLESANMRRLLATLKQQFDVIIIDAPPVLSVADPGILAAQADGTILVVRSGKTQRRIVMQAQSQLQQMRANLIGCVLTHVEYYMPSYYQQYYTTERQASKGTGHGQASPLAN